MSDNNSNLEYVKQQALNSADQKTYYPAIYVLWGCLIFIGFLLAEFKIDFTHYYWLITAPIGMFVSARLGKRKDKLVGQQKLSDGKLQLQHYSILLVCIAAAISTQHYDSILLVIALGYGLAGIHMDRPMLWIGALIFLTYLGVAFHIINNYIIVGSLIATGCFLSAWFTAKQS